MAVVPSAKGSHFAIVVKKGRHLSSSMICFMSRFTGTGSSQFVTSSSNVNGAISSGRMGWARHVARMK